MSHDVLAFGEALLRLQPEGDGRIEDAAQRFGSRVIVLTRGGEGGLSLDEDGVRCASVFPSTRVDRIGAGDAFSAGFLYATLTGWRERALDYGPACAALKRSLPGDTLLTTPEEVERVVAREVREIRR